MNRNEPLNRAATFLPQTTPNELPAVRIDDALVFVYFDDGDNLCITVDAEDRFLPTYVVFGSQDRGLFTGRVN